MATHQYEPLTDQKGIRLICLHSVSTDDDLSCDLQHASLVNPPFFEALSYTWGDPGQKRPLRCGDGVVYITINLYTALRHIRHVDETRTIWADALCIDQNNLAERNKQVQLMADIYSCTSATLIWLGEETLDVTRSFETIQLAREMLPSASGQDIILAGLEGSESFDSQAFYLSQLKKSKSDETNLLDVDWKGVACLLERHWFRRKWIIQEVAKSRTLLMICGSQTLQWDILTDVILYIQVHSFVSINGRIATRPLANIAMSNFVQLFYARLSNSCGIEWKLEVPYFFAATAAFSCSDDRDNIIALLNLASGVTDEDKNFIVDYSLPATETFRRYSQWLLWKHDSLQFLDHGFNPASRQNVELPSWLPYIDSNGDSNLKQSAADLSFLYNTAKGSKPRATFDTNSLNAPPKALLVWGRRVDEIKTLSDVLSISVEGVQPEEALRVLLPLSVWFRECEQIASKTGSLSHLVSKRSEELWRILSWDREGATDRTSSPAFGSVILRCLELLKMLENGFQGLAESMYTELQITLRRMKFVFGALRERRFCSTVSGRLGVVSADAKIGDRICMFYGGRLPFIIRPLGNTEYAFVGDGYIHGIMDGEAVNMEDLKDEEFTLV